MIKLCCHIYFVYPSSHRLWPSITNTRNISEPHSLKCDLYYIWNNIHKWVICSLKWLVFIWLFTVMMRKLQLKRCLWNVNIMLLLGSKVAKLLAPVASQWERPVPKSQSAVCMFSQSSHGFLPGAGLTICSWYFPAFSPAQAGSAPCHLWTSISGYRNWMNEQLIPLHTTD